MSTSGERQRPQLQGDILAVMAERITEYNRWHPEPVHPLFASVQENHLPLPDLLQQDAEELAEWNTGIRQILGDVHFEQSSRQLPGATSIYHDEDGSWTISVNTPLLHLIHAFTGVSLLLTAPDKTHNLAVHHRPTVLSREWDDGRLWLALMRDIENFFVPDSFLQLESSGYQYLHAPYDYCLSVIGARKFIVAHELAHILLGHHYSRAEGTLTAGEKKEQEYEADRLALDILFQKFKGRDLDEPEEVELKWMARGVFTLFALMFYPERMLGWYGAEADHPRSEYRLLNAMRYLANDEGTSTRDRRHFYRVSTDVIQTFQSLHHRAVNVFGIMDAESHREMMRISQIMKSFERRPKDLNDFEIRLFCQNTANRFSADYAPTVIKRELLYEVERGYLIRFRFDFEQAETAWLFDAEDSIVRLAAETAVEDDIHWIGYELAGASSFTLHLELLPSTNASRVVMFLDKVKRESRLDFRNTYEPHELETISREVDKMEDRLKATVRRAEEWNERVLKIYQQVATDTPDPFGHWL